MTPSSPVAKRDYAGQTARARADARRVRLIEAGFDLFGTVGYRGTSVRAVLRQSGVGERYFYESFDSLEDLLVAVGQQVHGEIKDAMLGALAELTDPTVTDMARACLLALAATLTDDPRRMRIAVVESIDVSAKVTRSANEVADWYVDLIVTSALATGPIPPLSAPIFAAALVGATKEVLVRWAAGTVPVDMPTLVEHLLIVVWGTLERAEALARLAEQ
jgi:AcrR family transcriptional regulator